MSVDEDTRRAYIAGDITLSVAMKRLYPNLIEDGKAKRCRSGRHLMNGPHCRECSNERRRERRARGVAN